MYKKKSLFNKYKKKAPVAKLSTRVYSNANTAYRIHRVASIDAFTSGAATETLKAYSFNLSQVPGYADFQGLFDSYKIDKVTITLQPYKSNEYDATTGVYTANTPRIYHAIDYDDDSAVAAVSDMQQYNNVKHTLAKYTIKRSFVPKISQTVYRTAITSAYMTPTKSIKLDMAYVDVPHYGFKLGMTASGNAGAFGYEVLCDFYISFYGIR